MKIYSMEIKLPLQSKSSNRYNFIVLFKIGLSRFIKALFFRSNSNLLESAGKTSLDSGTRLILCFHYIGSLFSPFRNDPSHFAVQWKQKCCWIDPACFLLPFGVIR